MCPNISRLESLIVSHRFPEGYVTLYHSSPEYYPVVSPLSLNPGTRFSRERLSSFWSDQEEYTIVFQIGRIVYDIIGTLDYICDIPNAIVYVKDVFKEKLLREIKSRKIYVHQVSVPVSYVSMGNSRKQPEYTLDRAVTPDKIHVLDYHDLYDRLIFLDSQKFSIKEKELIEAYSQTGLRSPIDRIIYYSDDELNRRKRKMRKSVMEHGKPVLKRKNEIMELINESELSDDDKIHLIGIVENSQFSPETLSTGFGGAMYAAGQAGMNGASTREMAIQRELSILYDNLRFSQSIRETQMLNNRIRQLEKELEKAQKSFRKSERLRSTGALGAGIGAVGMIYNSHKQKIDAKRQREIEQYGLQGFEDVY